MSTRVETSSGTLEGITRGGMRSWLGIPYARAPRFAAPRPAEPWSGVRKAQAFAPQCPQQIGKRINEKQLQPPGFAEDCLALNIWSSEGGEAKKPVFVWIHGGAFLVGGSDLYKGYALAEEGDVVVVTINYRLGVLGFVNFGEALDAPDMPSNLGIRDMIAALRWVKENIAAFGGDPDRVTIAGESAGSIAVSLLMVAPAARGLFHGAVMQSGALTLIHDREKSRKVAARYAELLGLSGGDVDRLRAMDLKPLFEAQAIVDQENSPGIPAAPWFDDDLLPATLDEAIAAETAPVPLIAGATREETRLFEVLPGDIVPTRRDGLDAMVRGNMDTVAADALLSHYPQTKAGRRALATDLAFAVPTRQFAERHSGSNPVWFYRFDYAHPLLGAMHAIDLTMLWPFSGFRAGLARGGPMTAKRQALAERMRDLWARFCHHGNPGDGWPAYQVPTRKVRLFDLDDTIADNPDAQRFGAWQGHLVAPR